jgi:hypothetical protein
MRFFGELNRRERRDHGENKLKLKPLAFVIGADFT